MWPNSGQEYMMSLQNQYVWNLLPKCGTCFFWNGFTNGGAPAFVDTVSGWLHPLSILATFWVGVFNSGKIIILASLFMAGMSQWWLGKILKFGPLARTWIALIFVASGALTGRMEIGSPPLLQSLAACSLVFPATLDLVLHGGKKATIVLGITLGLAMLGGQSYPQIGLVLCWVPMVVFLLLKGQPNESVRLKPEWRNFFIAGILGALIAAPFLLPASHNLPILSKDVDPDFGAGQPLKYIVLNLVINDLGFYNTTVLGKMPYPYLNVNYIGWVPVIFAILGLFLAPSRLRKTNLGILLAITIIYLTSSAVLLKWIHMLPFGMGEFAIGIRSMGQIQGLAGPLVLALTGIGIDELLKKEWPQVTFSLSKSKSGQSFGFPVVSVKWLVLFVPMLLALYSVADFSKNWLFVGNINLNTKRLIEPLKTPDAQWVQPPLGEYTWLPAAMENNMKIGSFGRPWWVSGEEMPQSYLQLTTAPNDINLPEFFKTYENYVILRRPDNLYAYVKKEGKIHACQATSLGGNIDVKCDVPVNGTLYVIERSVGGWKVTRDGQEAALVPNSWLTLDAPAGKHTYAFRYRPWDAPVGIGLAILGWIAALTGWMYHSKKGKAPVKEPSQEHISA